MKKVPKEALLEQLYAICKAPNNLAQLTYPGSKSIVFGEGNYDAKLMLFGEAPGADEDEQGRPFVGRSGKLLTKSLEAIGVPRNSIFISNIVKARPPKNRKPTEAEVQKHRPILLKQIEIIEPQVICTLGACALEGLTGKPVKITRMRGKPINWEHLIIVPTYHPAYILRNPKEVATFISDLEKALKLTQ